MGDNWVHIAQICDEIFGKVHKDMGGGEERYLCPFHDDTNPSCDVNKAKGVYVCRACGKSGSLYDLAKEYNYSKPHLYIPNGNGVEYRPVLRTEPKPPVTSEMIETVRHSQKYLNEHLDLIPPNWNKDVVQELGIGRHQHQWLYPYIDDSELIGYKLGKITQEPKGNIKCRVFPSRKYISKYDYNKPLYIYEGEGDCITGISLGTQGISFTSGAGAIPRDKDGKYDLKWFLKWRIIVICYDNDIAGRNGAIKLKNKIMEVANNG